MLESISHRKDRKNLAGLSGAWKSRKCTGGSSSSCSTSRNVAFCPCEKEKNRNAPCASGQSGWQDMESDFSRERWGLFAGTLFLAIYFACRSGMAGDSLRKRFWKNRIALAGALVLIAGICCRREWNRKRNPGTYRCRYAQCRTCKVGTCRKNTCHALRSWRDCADRECLRM